MAKPTRDTTSASLRFFFHIRHLLLFFVYVFYVYLTLFVIIVKRNWLSFPFFIFKALYRVCYIFYLLSNSGNCYCAKIYFLWGAFLKTVIFFLSDLFVRGEKFICLWNMCVPFPFLKKKKETKNSLFFYILWYIGCVNVFGEKLQFIVL